MIERERESLLVNASPCVQEAEIWCLYVKEKERDSDS